MELEITFIRNGITCAGDEKRFEGEFNESLSPDGIEGIRRRIKENQYPRVSRVYTGSNKRCLETTSLIYGSFPALVMNGIDSIDFGSFAGCQYSEIREDPRFVQWAQSEDVDEFPGGESPYVSIAQNIRGFKSIIQDMEEYQIYSAAVITHRMAILLILNRFSFPLHRYPEQIICHGGGCTVLFDTRLSALKIKNTF